MRAFVLRFVFSAFFNPFRGILPLFVSDPSSDTDFWSLTEGTALSRDAAEVQRASEEREREGRVLRDRVRAGEAGCQIMAKKVEQAHR